MSEASVRHAMAADIGELARIHVTTWRYAYADVLPAEVLAELSEQTIAQRWDAVLRESDDVLLLAEEGGQAVGLCLAGHAEPDDIADADEQLPPDAPRVATIRSLLVEPRWTRRGHGGRLLATAAGHLAKDAERGVAWIPEADTASLAFYEHLGWASDGLVRTLDAAGSAVREIRMTGTLQLSLTPTP